jgi:ABC-type dipeptide/oligopeptide/nickel transport system ATPase component
LPKEIHTDHRLPEVRLNDRMAIFGMTGSGKSVLAHYLFQSVPNKLPTEKNPMGFWRMCIDVTDSVIENSLTFEDPRNVPWDEAASLRFVPDIGTLEESINAVYEEIMNHGSCWVWLDEANEVSSAHRTIVGLRRILLQGRKFQIGNVSVTPRPVDITKSITTQSEHHFIFTLIEQDDRKRVAKNIGLELEEFDEVMAGLEPFGYLWFSIRDKTIYEMPALPEEIVAKLEGMTLKKTA